MFFLLFASELLIPEPLYVDQRISRVFTTLLEHVGNVKVTSKASSSLCQNEAPRIIVPCVGNSRKEVNLAFKKADIGMCAQFLQYV